MNQRIASIFRWEAVHVWYEVLLFLAVLTASFAARYWRFVVQWMEGIRGREWTAISAVIDVVSVVEQIETNRGEQVAGYLVTLTYFYRNAELQMGEYCRMFREEVSAQAWAALHKGRTVMVHVDPRDPSRSVLRKEDL